MGSYSNNLEILEMNENNNTLNILEKYLWMQSGIWISGPPHGINYLV